MPLFVYYMWYLTSKIPRTPLPSESILKFSLPFFTTSKNVLLRISSNLKENLQLKAVLVQFEPYEPDRLVNKFGISDRGGPKSHVSRLLRFFFCISVLLNPIHWIWDSGLSTTTPFHRGLSTINKKLRFSLKHLVKLNASLYS